MKSIEERILHQLTELNHKMEKDLSFRHAFLSGVVKGLGYAVGASVIAAVVLGVLSQTVEFLPFIQ